MASSSGGESTCSASVIELKIPPDLDAEVSTLSIKQLEYEKIVIGHESGIYILSIETTELVDIVKRLNSFEVPSIFVDKNSNGNLFYAASENYVYKFDIRCPLDKEIHCYRDNTDEVNHITINEKNYLASCDDSGECKIFDTRKETL